MRETRSEIRVLVCCWSARTLTHYDGFSPLRNTVPAPRRHFAVCQRPGHFDSRTLLGPTSLTPLVIGTDPSWNMGTPAMQGVGTPGRQGWSPIAPKTLRGV